jgi:hypothetical protein
MMKAPKTKRLALGGKEFDMSDLVNYWAFWSGRGKNAIPAERDRWPQAHPDTVLNVGETHHPPAQMRFADSRFTILNC